MSSKKFDRGTLARKSAITFTLMMLLGSLLAPLTWSVVVGVVFWHWYLVAGFAICILALAAYKHGSYIFNTTIVLINAGVMILACSFDIYQMAEFKPNSPQQLIGIRLILFATAIVAPNPMWSGYLIIGVAAATPFLLYLLSPLYIQAGLLQNEQWMALLYAVVAALILRHRHEEIRMGRLLAKIQAEHRATSQLAAIFLSLRDLTNSPLQSVELTAHLLKLGKLSKSEAARHLENSLMRLKDLSRVLQAYEKNMDWQHTEVAFEASSYLQKKLFKRRAAQNANMR